MKLETALKVIRLMADKGKGFCVILHISPEREVKIEKHLTLKYEEDAHTIVKKLIQE